MSLLGLHTEWFLRWRKTVFTKKFTHIFNAIFGLDSPDWRINNFKNTRLFVLTAKLYYPRRWPIYGTRRTANTSHNELFEFSRVGRRNTLNDTNSVACWQNNCFFLNVFFSPHQKSRLIVLTRSYRFAIILQNDRHARQILFESN